MVRENVGIDYGSTADASLNLYSAYRVLTPNAPEATFTLTPYRGSCNPTPGVLGVDTEAQYRVQAFKMNPEIDTFAGRTGRTNIRVVPPDQHPGYYNPSADNPYLYRQETRHYYRDMWWSVTGTELSADRDPMWRHWNKSKREYGYRVPGMSLPDENKWYRDLTPSPPFPAILSDHYDCYGEYYAAVAPEELEIEASVIVLQLLTRDSRTFSSNLETLTTSMILTTHTTFHSQFQRITIGHSRLRTATRCSLQRTWWRN
ncbi:MAG: hypothetical protein R2883_03190 [Caldisericia bacterium]